MQNAGRSQASFSLSASDGFDGRNRTWILDSGASRHLVINKNMLTNAIDCFNECNVADVQSINVTKVGQDRSNATVDGTAQVITLGEVYYG